MKLSNAVLMISAMASTASALNINSKNAAKVLRAASRRVEENEEEEAEDGEYDYLMKYTLKMVGCKAGEQVINAESGEYEQNAAVFQLCPTDGECTSETGRGCTGNYGEFVVGLGTYVEAFFEDQGDNWAADDQVEVDKYATCEEYNVEMDDDASAAAWEDYQFFIGPACTESGGVRMALFTDEDCMYESTTSFSDISGGWSLPYSSGGLVSTSCIDCEVVDDDGAYEAREMCEELYEAAGSKCEANMEYFSYYGQNVAGCEYIAEIMPLKTSGGSAGKVFGWIVFIALIGGLAGYIVWWRKRKSGASDGLVA
jgi:hypothetical protein